MGKVLQFKYQLPGNRLRELVMYCNVSFASKIPGKQGNTTSGSNNDSVTDPDPFVLCLLAPDPGPLVRGMDPVPVPDPSIIKHK